MALIEIIRDRPPSIGCCRADNCRRQIEWCRTASGKKIPLNTPVIATTVVRGDSFVTVIDTASVHWATCPESKSFKRRPSRK